MELKKKKNCDIIKAWKKLKTQKFSIKSKADL